MDADVASEAHFLDALVAESMTRAILSAALDSTSSSRCCAVLEAACAASRTVLKARASCKSQELQSWGLRGFPGLSG